MTVSEIYTQYRIMPFLQLHQLRVAGVAKMMLDHFDGALDRRNTLLACLFHDMGNIVKSDLNIFPEEREPGGLAYWEKIKADFIRRYGSSAHHATIALCHELHLPLQAIRYIDNVGLSRLEYVRDTPSIEQKIVQYADTRVAPHGVVSQRERLDDARLRYKDRPGAIESDTERFNTLARVAEEIEQQLFASMPITPADITEASVQPYFEELRHFKTT